MFKKKTCTRRGFAIGATVWGGAVAAAAGLTALATLSPTTDSAEAVSAASTTVAAPAPALADVCVSSFSKDICESVWYPGQISTGSCPTSVTRCKTLVEEGVKWEFRMDSSQMACDDKCDEAPRKSGKMTVKLDYTLRLQKPCPYRGCYMGEWKYQCDDGSVYTGTVTGTLGAGSHRKNTTCDYGGRDCEKCTDVSMYSFLQWRIGTEATFVGYRADVISPSPTRDEICFSLSGDFMAPAYDDGTLNFEQKWRFFGTVEGVHIGCP